MTQGFAYGLTHALAFGPPAPQPTKSDAEAIASDWAAIEADFAQETTLKRKAPKPNASVRKRLAKQRAKQAARDEAHRRLTEARAKPRDPRKRGSLQRLLTMLGALGVQADITPTHRAPEDAQESGVRRAEGDDSEHPR